jgi:hypothetical protein
MLEQVSLGGDHQLFDFQFDISLVSGCMIDRLLIRGGFKVSAFGFISKFFHQA